MVKGAEGEVDATLDGARVATGVLNALPPVQTLAETRMLAQRAQLAQGPRHAPTRPIGRGLSQFPASGRPVGSA